MESSKEDFKKFSKQYGQDTDFDGDKIRMKSIGELILDEMVKRKLSVEDLQERSGLSESAIRYFLQESIPGQQEQMERIAGALGISLAELYEYDTEKEKASKLLADDRVAAMKQNSLTLLNDISEEEVLDQIISDLEKTDPKQKGDVYGSSI